MKRLTALVALVAMVTAFVLFGVGDSAASVADTSVPGDEVATSVNETDKSDSATATITIIMRTPALPKE